MMERQNCQSQNDEIQKYIRLIQQCPVYCSELGHGISRANIKKQRGLVQHVDVTTCPRQRKKTMPNTKVAVARALVRYGWSFLVSFFEITM
jgi:hypothetical protein